MLKTSKGLKRATVISTPTPFNMDRLAEAVEKLEFRELGKTQEDSWGFTRPDFTDLWPLVPRCNNVYIFTIRHDRRVPNKSRLSREWHKAIEEKEKAEKRRLNKEEKDSLRETVKTRLFPNTAPNENTYQAIYDADKRILIVAESNSPSVEFVVDKLNVALKDQGIGIEWKGNLIEAVLEDTLTAWLYKPDSLPKEYKFEVGTSMRLENESCKAALTNHIADSEEVRIHLHHEKHVGQLQLTWNDQVDFVLSSKRILSQMNFKSYCSEKIKEIQEGDSHDSLRTYQQATFLVFYNAFLELWNAVSNIPTEI